MTTAIRLSDDLWATSMLPEGTLERWLVADASYVNPGDAVAAVRIDEALHDIMAPKGGRITIIMSSGEIIEPGSLIARLTVE